MRRKQRQWDEAARRLPPDAFERYSATEPGETLTVPIANRQITVRQGTPDVVVAQSCLLGEFEAVRFLLDREYAGVIVDAGGYIGTAALALHELFPKARIITVEPAPENFDILIRNVAEVPQIQPIRGALVANKAGTVMLRNRGTGQWGFTAVETPQDNPDASDMHDVPALRLGDLVENGAEIGLLKLDIEGGELDLLTHDADTLAGIPNIFIELHNRIAPGCRAAFFRFSEDRIVVRADGEKYLSIRR